MQSWQSPHGRALPVPGGRTLIMGVLNVTPDSFSDGGQLPTSAAVVERARAMLVEGADVLDIGGESTRPGAKPVSAEEELARVLPAIAAIRAEFPGTPISVDTYKAAVAEAAIAAGADIINDIWGLAHGLTPAERERWREHLRGPLREERDRGQLGPCAHALGHTEISPRESGMADTRRDLRASAMAVVAARLNAPVIAMHNRPDREYGDFWRDVLLDLCMSLAIAKAAGIPTHQIWLDPGFGFAKNPPHNLEVLRELHRIVALGHPVLVGTSRKSTIGAVLGTTVNDRLEGGGATVVWAVQQGCAMIRVHDVHEMARFARMADAIKAGLRFSPG